MRFQKLAAPVLALSLTLSMSAPALAAEKHPFTDVPTWAEAAVTYSYDKGYVNGTGATTYNSDGQISVVEFIKIMVQMCTTQEQRTAIMDKAGATPEQAADWTYQYRTIGKEIGLYAGIEQYESDKGETKCTRAVMAHILVSALKARGEDISTVDATAYLDKFNDAAAIKNSPYVNDIGTAISLGLIGGDNNHNFLPDDTMNRASAAQVLLRLDNPNGERAKVLDTLKNPAVPPVDTDRLPNRPGNSGNTTGNSQTNTQPITIDMRDSKTTHRAPLEGDTVIRPDGTSVVLVRDKATGVLGLGQNAGAFLYTLAIARGDGLIEGDFIGGGASIGSTDPLAGGQYLKSTIPGQDYTYHFAAEWRAISDATSPNQKGTQGTKDGELDSTGYWKYCLELDCWAWRGPSF